jgi:dUTP pyrophosphatase
LKHGITVLNAPATIDNSYRKEIGVILINHGHDPYTIRKGDKIAQMLIRKLEVSEFEEVKEIDDTGRGGYGSTGK